MVERFGSDAATPLVAGAQALRVVSPRG